MDEPTKGPFPVLQVCRDNQNNQFKSIMINVGFPTRRECHTYPKERLKLLKRADIYTESNQLMKQAQVEISSKK